MTRLAIVGTIAAALPVLLMPIGSNAVYFSVMPHWFLLPVAAAFLARALPTTATAFAWRTGLAAWCMLLVPALLFAPLNLDVKGLRGMLAAFDDASAAGGQMMREPQAMKRYFMENLAAHRTLFDERFGREFEDNPWVKVMHQVRGEARAAGSGFAVFVPPTNRAFWNKLEGTGPYWCADMHLFIPSQTGVPMLRGLQPADQGCPMFAPGSPDYGPESRTADLDDAALCRHGAIRGIKTIFVLDTVGFLDNGASNRTIACHQAR